MNIEPIQDDDQTGRLTGAAWQVLEYALALFARAGWVLRLVCRLFCYLFLARMRP